MFITKATPKELDAHMEDILNLSEQDPDYEPLDKDSYVQCVLRWIRTFVDDKTADYVAKHHRGRAENPENN